MASDEERYNSGAENNGHAPYGGEEEEDTPLQALLDDAYDQLDRFVEWVEGYLELNTRTAQQDCFNAEFLIDYLVNQFEKPVAEINEFELRWFVFSHYIRKAMADAETEERLPDSLLRFFHFMGSEEGMTVPAWVQT